MTTGRAIGEALLSEAGFEKQAVLWMIWGKRGAYWLLLVISFRLVA